MGIQGNGWYFFAWDFNGLSKVAALYTTEKHTGSRVKIQSPVSNTCVQNPGILVCPFSNLNESVT